MHPPFSVVLPTYAGDEPAHLDEAIRSVREQTVPPTELVIVEDGPLPSNLSSVIGRHRHERILAGGDVGKGGELKRIKLPENRGRGLARRVGVTHCSHDLLAFMDADDISHEERFERQLSVLSERPELDLVGGYFAEFQSDPEEIHAIRSVPTTHDEIASRARFASPVNTITVMCRRDAILSAGNFRRAPGVEDYDMWVRMLMDGSTFANIPEILAKARIDDAYRRRAGMDLAVEEVRRQYTFYRIGFIDVPVLLFNLLTRPLVRLAPVTVRRWAIKRFDRTNVDG